MRLFSFEVKQSAALEMSFELRDFQPRCSGGTRLKEFVRR